MSYKQGIIFKETNHIRKSGKRRYEIDIGAKKGRYKILKQSTDYNWILALYIGLRSGLLTENEVKNAKNIKCKHRIQIKHKYGVQIEHKSKGYYLYDGDELLKVSTIYDFIILLYNKYIHKELTADEIKKIKKSDIIPKKKKNNIYVPKSFKTQPVFNLGGKTPSDILYLSGIYYIRNRLNNKIYIGLSIHIGLRFEEHLYDLSNNNDSKHLQNSWNKYGPHNFEFGIICLASEDRLSDLEKYYITYIYESFKRENGYNIKKGGREGYLLDIRTDTDLQKDVFEMFENSISINKIAQKYNVNTRIIREILAQKGYELPGNNHRHDINTNDLIKDYNNGMSRTQLTKKYDCSLETINHRFKKSNLHIHPLKNRRKINLQYDSIFNDIKNGETYAQIALKNNCSVDTISRFCKKNNIQYIEPDFVISFLPTDKKKYKISGQKIRQIKRGSHLMNLIYSVYQDLKKEDQEDFLLFCKQDLLCSNIPLSFFDECKNNMYKQTHRMSEKQKIKMSKKRTENVHNFLELDEDAIINDYKKGLLIKDIAKKHNVSKDTIRYRLIKKGVISPNKSTKGLHIIKKGYYKDKTQRFALIDGQKTIYVSSLVNIDKYVYDNYDIDAQKEYNLSKKEMLYKKNKKPIRIVKNGTDNGKQRYKFIGVPKIQKQLKHKRFKNLSEYIKKIYTLLDNEQKQIFIQDCIINPLCHDIDFSQYPNF